MATTAARYISHCSSLRSVPGRGFSPNTRCHHGYRVNRIKIIRWPFNIKQSNLKRRRKTQTHLLPPKCLSILSVLWWNRRRKHTVYKYGSSALPRPFYDRKHANVLMDSDDGRQRWCTQRCDSVAIFSVHQSITVCPSVHLTVRWFAFLAAEP